MVVVNGRDPAKAEQTLAALDAGDRVHFIAGDVKQREACEAIVDGTVDHFGRIDILVANAGGASGHAPIVDLTDEAMQDSLVWNFWHTFWTMRRALPLHDPAAVRARHERQLAGGQGRQARHLDLRRGQARHQRARPSPQRTRSARSASR